MITIFHNPRCSKSREGLQVLQESGKEYQVREYLKVNFSEEELTQLLQKLQLSPKELVRTNEKIWKEEFKNKDFTDSELIKILVAHPKLIQRPIVSNGKKAVLARPASEISKLLD